jgi:predicted lipid-binding transport protein (Tim44 family)
MSIIWVERTADQASLRPTVHDGAFVNIGGWRFSFTPDAPISIGAAHFLRLLGRAGAMSKVKLNWRVLLALCLCACLALAPALAEARAGSSFGGRPSSFGSRGVRSWDYNGAQPLGRSMAPQGPSQPNFAPGMPAPAYGGSVFQRHPFLTGLAGGLFGSWLLGHAAYAEGGGGAGSAIGTLLWIVIIGLLIWFAVRLFRARAFPGGWPAIGAAAPVARSGGAAASPARRFRGRDVNLADADLEAFHRLHAAIQDAWSAGDLGRMRRLMTPEMLSYFSEELTRNTSRGLRNVVENVQLVSGELNEAWEEGDLQYATAFLRWRAVDYVLRLGASPGDRNAVVGGDPRAPAQIEEVWTFVRRRGGDWLLSAIQQV